MADSVAIAKSRMNPPVKVEIYDYERARTRLIPPVHVPKREVDDERAIAELLYADMSANLRAQEEQAVLLRRELSNVRQEIATMLKENVKLHAENARLQEMIKGLTGSYSILTANNGEVVKNMMNYV